MKKLTLAIAVFALTFSANSQEARTSKLLISKKGTPILPQMGDFAIGVDAQPFLTYIGNIFGKNTSNNAPTFNTDGPNMSITGKYFLDNQTAYRASVRVGVTSTKDDRFVRDDVAYAADNSTTATVTDTQKNSASSILLGLGLEKRRGYGRLQGIYGIMGQLAFSTNKTTIDHGNAITLTNKFPTRTYNYNENKSGTTFGIGASGFVGVEYFIAPKLSLGGEFSYGLFYSNTGDGSYERDAWDASSSEIKTTTTESAGDSTFSLDNSATSSISLNFYF